MLKIKTICMDYEEIQTGITHVPQLSWILENDKRNVLQDHYEIQAATDLDFVQIVYSSGKMDSDESAQIEMKGFQLKSVTRYYIRVRVWASGECTSWAVTSFVTGMIHNEEWKAEFITVETEKDADNSKGTYLRREISLRGKVKEAFVCSTALGLYKFYINGKKVGNDELTPGWTSYRKHLCYQTYDVTSYLHQGENALGAILGAGWYKGLMGFGGLRKRRNHYGKVTAFLAQLIVRYEDGTDEVFLTDEKWTGEDAPIIFSEIYDGETYDARKEIPGWNETGCNKGNWNPAKIVEYDKKVLTGQGSGKTAEIDKMEPVEILKTPQGDIVLDFGQNMSAHIQVRAKGKAGDVIELQCFETLDADGNVYLDNLRGVKESEKYIFAKDGEITYTPSFTFMGFRYARIVAFPGEPELCNFTAFSLHTRMKPSGKFNCSNKDLNQLMHNVLWGLKSNFVDVPTDCPQRDERLGWTGDAQIFSRTACFLMNTYSFYRKWLRDVEADQTPEGGVPHVVPDIISGNAGDNWLLQQGTHSAAAWADAAVIIPWNMYLTFGDKEILRVQYTSMKKWIEFMREHSQDYIWNYKLQFGDWVALDAEEGSYFGATPNELTCTAYFAYSTGLFCKIAAVLGEKKDEEEYGKLYEKIVDKFQRTFFDKEGSLIAQTQTAHIVALYFGLVPEKYKKAIVDGLLKLLKKENGHLVTGFVGTPYFCHALSSNGHVKEAYDLLMKDDFPSWLYQVKMGATTIWEHWDGIHPDGTMWSPEMNSFNHYAYGAVGEWIIRVAAGLEINEKEPGYKHSVIYPRIGGGLTYVKCSYDSVYGIVESFWEKKDETVILHVQIPVNTTATICLDKADMVLDSDSLDFKVKDGVMQAETGSGNYTIQFMR